MPRARLAAPERIAPANSELGHFLRETQRQIRQRRGKRNPDIFRRVTQGKSPPEAGNRILGISLGKHKGRSAGGGKSEFLTFP